MLCKRGNECRERALKGLLHHLVYLRRLRLILADEGGDNCVIVFQNSPFGKTLNNSIGSGGLPAQLLPTEIYKLAALYRLVFPQNKAEAIAFKAEYDEKLKNAEKEVDGILSEGRKKALKRENEIVDEAKAEAVRILERADREIELEKSKMKDEVKKEMVAVASVMAGKIIAASIDTDKQAQLIDEALNEMGDDTWRSWFQELMVRRCSS